MARRGPNRASERRRMQILEAALACFVERGLLTATIEDIRDRSGASIGSICHHFGTKEELAAALFVEGLTRFNDGFVPAVTSRRSARAGIETGVRHHITWFAENPDWGRFLLHARQSELLGDRVDAIRELNSVHFRRIREWLQPFEDRGEVTRLPMSVLTALWIGPAQEYARQWLSGVATTPPEEAGPVLSRAAWQAIKAPG